MICTLQPCRRELGGGAQNSKAPRSVLMQLSVWWLVAQDVWIGVAWVLGIGIMGVLVRVVMDEKDQNSSEEWVRLSLEMPADLLLWVDQLKGKLGLRSRSDLIVRLMQEVRGEA